MNRNLKLLNRILEKKERHILGLMSGTSMDGLDLALCTISGYGKNINVEVEYFTTFPYDNVTIERLKSLVSVKSVDLEQLCIFNDWFGNRLGEIVSQTLKDWGVKPAEVDCIASHGQTVYHVPKSHHAKNGLSASTLQVGDGDHLAVSSGILTLSDFRQKHTAVGGEGAPLAVYEDYLMYQSATEDRILLNIGGIANFTYLPHDGSFQDIVCTDTGPGNTLINRVVDQRFKGLPYDMDGNFAMSGSVNDKLLSLFLSHPFFEVSLPKTTGPELFNLNFVDDALNEANLTAIDNKNLVATVTRLTAESISQAIRQVKRPNTPCSVYVSGGGVHNKALMKWLSESITDCDVKSFSELGIDPDAKEAVLFALLANESLWGDGLPLVNKNGQTIEVGMGKISFPN